MDKNILLQQILLYLNKNEITACFQSIRWLAMHNAIAKTFTISDLKKIDDSFKNCRTKKPVVFDFIVQQHVYNRKSGASAFINEAPFLIFYTTENVRAFASYFLRTKSADYLTCLDIDARTNEKQAWKLVNTFGKRNLKKLPEHLRYDIITKPENFEFYRKQHPTARITSYAQLSDLALHWH